MSACIGSPSTSVIWSVPVGSRGSRGPQEGELDYARRLAISMQKRHAPGETLRADAVYAEHSPALVEEILLSLVPERLIIFVAVKQTAEDEEEGRRAAAESEPTDPLKGPQTAGEVQQATGSNLPGEHSHHAPPRINSDTHHRPVRHHASSHHHALSPLTLASHPCAPWPLPCLTLQGHPFRHGPSRHCCGRAAGGRSA